MHIIAIEYICNLYSTWNSKNLVKFYQRLVLKQHEGLFWMTIISQGRLLGQKPSLLTPTPPMRLHFVSIDFTYTRLVRTALKTVTLITKTRPSHLTSGRHTRHPKVPHLNNSKLIFIQRAMFFKLRFCLNRVIL